MALAVRRSVSITMASLVASTLAACGSASVGAPVTTSADVSASSSASTPMTGIFGSNPIQSVAVRDACRAVVLEIQTALEASYAMKDRYATTLGALVKEGLLHADADISASSGTTMTHTSAPGTFTVKITGGGTPTVSGTVDGKLC